MQKCSCISLEHNTVSTLGYCCQYKKSLPLKEKYVCYKLSAAHEGTGRRADTGEDHLQRGPGFAGRTACRLILSSSSTGHWHGNNVSFQGHSPEGFFAFHCDLLQKDDRNCLLSATRYMKSETTCQRSTHNSAYQCKEMCLGEQFRYSSNWRKKFRIHNEHNENVGGRELTKPASSIVVP